MLTQSVSQTFVLLNYFPASFFSTACLSNFWYKSKNSAWSSFESAFFVALIPSHRHVNYYAIVNGAFASQDTYLQWGSCFRTLRVLKTNVRPDFSKLKFALPKECNFTDKRHELAKAIIWFYQAQRTFNHRSKLLSVHAAVVVFVVFFEHLGSRDKHGCNWWYKFRTWVAFSTSALLAIAEKNYKILSSNSFMQSDCRLRWNAYWPLFCARGALLIILRVHLYASTRKAIQLSKQTLRCV